MATTNPRPTAKADTPAQVADAAPLEAAPAPQAPTAPVRLLAPDDLDVVGLGHVKAGQAYDVPATLAGTAPNPRYHQASLELAAAVAAIDHATAQARREELIDLAAAGGQGYGLLAQGWSLAPAGTRTAAELAAAQATTTTTVEGDAQ